MIKFLIFVVVYFVMMVLTNAIFTIYSLKEDPNCFKNENTYKGADRVMYAMFWPLTLICAPILLNIKYLIRFHYKLGSFVEKHFKK